MLVLKEYARHHFKLEVTYYPKPILKKWLDALRVRIIDRAIDLIAKLEELGQSHGMSLEHHGVTPKDATNVMWEELDRFIAERLVPPKPQKTAPAPPIEIGSRTGFQGLTGKQADRYKRAGIDLESPAPIQISALAAAQNAGRGDHKQLPSGSVVTIGEQIESLRERFHVTVEQMAEALRVSPKSISRHLSGEYQPSKKHLVAYEKLFSQLLGERVFLQTSPRRPNVPRTSLKRP